VYIPQNKTQTIIEISNTSSEQLVIDHDDKIFLKNLETYEKLIEKIEFLSQPRKE